MSYRNLEINGRNWRYKVGASFLDIRNPEGKGYRPRKEEVGEYVARSEDDPSLGDALTVQPGHIRKWIESHAV